MAKAMQPTSKTKSILRIFLALVFILTISLSGFVIWASNPLGPMPEALEALQSDARVKVVVDRWLVFEPVGTQPTSGLIFYPGGRVDARSYAPGMRALAENGYLAVIVPMPLNLAVFGINQADGVIAAFPQIKHWAIAGHSLGGAMAASYVSNHSGKIQGLILLASYPAEGDDLSDRNLKVTSIFGTSDGMASPTEVLNAAPQLPADTRWVSIEGGNHGQFGWYGSQPGDNPATISRPEQQEQILSASIQNLMSIVSQGESAGALMYLNGAGQ
jgi:hypothetical protein